MSGLTNPTVDSPADLPDGMTSGRAFVDGIASVDAMSSSAQSESAAITGASATQLFVRRDGSVRARSIVRMMFFSLEILFVIYLL